MESLLPAGYKMLDNFATSITYEFPYLEGSVSGLFDSLTRSSKDNGILDWGISQTRYEKKTRERKS